MVCEFLPVERSDTACLLLIGSLLWAFLPADAQRAHTSSVIAGSGGRAGGSAYEHIGAGAQPGGIVYGTAGGLGGLQNYAGFLGTFSLRPDLIAADGLEHELSADNDGDGLSDIEEIVGSAFDPATPTDPNHWDTSGDGISDYAHAIAGTDPTRTGSYLRIQSMTRSSGEVTLTWLARQDRSYRVLAADESHATPTNLIDTAIGDIGVGPWQVTTNTISFPATGALQTFGIEVQSP